MGGDGVLAAADAVDEWATLETRRLPGSRLLVQFGGDDWWHERISGFPVDSFSYIIAAADGDEYVEDSRSWTAVRNMAGRREYPADLTGGITQFRQAWAPTNVLGSSAVAVPLPSRRSPRTTLSRSVEVLVLGWTGKESGGTLC